MRIRLIPMSAREVVSGFNLIWNTKIFKFINRQPRLTLIKAKRIRE